MDPKIVAGISLFFIIIIAVLAYLLLKKTCPVPSSTSCPSASCPSASIPTGADALALALGSIANPECPNFVSDWANSLYNSGVRAVPSGTACPTGTSQVAGGTLGSSSVSYGVSTSRNGYSICYPIGFDLFNSAGNVCGHSISDPVTLTGITATDYATWFMDNGLRNKV